MSSECALSSLAMANILKTSDEVERNDTETGKRRAWRRSLGPKWGHLGGGPSGSMERISCRVFVSEIRLLNKNDCFEFVLR